jgi:hypothetical protein
VGFLAVGGVEARIDAPGLDHSGRIDRIGTARIRDALRVGHECSPSLTMEHNVVTAFRFHGPHRK